MRARSFFFALPALLVLSLSAAAQTAPPPVAAGETEVTVPGDRYSQQIERIEVQDSNARIDELRVGGQTQSITVQPKGAPRYEVQPANPATDAIQERDRGPGSAGRRTWKILDF